MTEKLLTGTLSLNTTNQHNQIVRSYVRSFIFPWSSDLDFALYLEDYLMYDQYCLGL